MTIILSDLTFTNQADIVPAQGGNVAIFNNDQANTLGGNDRITGTAIGLNAGISNGSGGSINTGGGDDSLKGTSGSGQGIFNIGQIETKGGNDSITGESYSSIGLSNAAGFTVGSINTGIGDDSIIGTSFGIGFGTFIGILNEGSINTGEGNDRIEGTVKGGNGKGTGISNGGTIDTGDGNDSIIGSSKDGPGILNNGVITTGSGQDVVDALIGGFAGTGRINLGLGKDTLIGFGSGFFNGGGGGQDTLLFGVGSYDISASANPEGFFTISFGGTDMLVKDFELIGSAADPGSAVDFASVVGTTFVV
jgi:hypothetical protein